MTIPSRWFLVIKLSLTPLFAQGRQSSLRKPAKALLYEKEKGAIDRIKKALSFRLGPRFLVHALHRGVKTTDP